MATHIDKGSDKSSKGLLFVLIALVALILGFYLYNQNREESGVSMQVGDREFSATVTEE